MEKKKLNQNQNFFCFFFVLNAIFKKWGMVAKKHHIQKEHGPKPWGMSFPGGSSISSGKIMPMKMRQGVRHFDTKRVKGLYQCDTFKQSIFFLPFSTVYTFKNILLISSCYGKYHFTWQKSIVKSLNAFFSKWDFQICWHCTLKSNYPIDLKFVLSTIKYIYSTMM